ncbi:hypothetical protein Taro_051134 [Colocasia esculenta]|uniref:Aminotransferase-like plant mobile domain-containing protein n=1 Tax=Colocasia esculenta TaxID=4460 RepID=A0A843XF67_COLES|nr:hypothetical protein [Colocasia esculenta]
MEGGGEEQGGGRRRVKKMIRCRQTGEGTSPAAQEDPATPMEEDIAGVVPDEDEPVGPKKSELRSRLGWAVVQAIYDGLPDFQRSRLEGMGFGPFLRLEELAPDVALIQALKERWDPECHAFLFLWGHMVPTLEDVVRNTGLRVDGQAVTVVTYTSYQEQVERWLGLEVRGERSSLVQRTALQASLGVANARHRTGESQADYMARLTEDARAVLAEEEGDAADRDLRRFLILMIGKLILGTRGDAVSYRSCPCWKTCPAWATTHGVRPSWPTSSTVWAPPIGRQVWAYHHLPSLGRGVARYSGLPMSGRTTPPSRGWSRAVPTSVGTFGFIASTRWSRSTTSWWRVHWGSIRQWWSSRPDRGRGRGLAGASAGFSRSRTRRSGSGSSWTIGSSGARRWSPRPRVTRTTSGPMPGGTGPRCIGGPDDR